MTHNNSTQLIGLLLVGGPTLVFTGLRQLNEKRLLENTPRSKVRSAAMGLVELTGVAQPFRTPIVAPVSQCPSCWWRCRVEEWRSNGQSSSWVTIHEGDSQTLLYLQDETGRVLILPTGAEFHVQNTVQDLNAATITLPAHMMSSWGLTDFNPFGGLERRRIIEDIIPEGAPLLVLGDLVSLAELPQAKEERFRAYLEAVKNDPTRMAEADADKDGVLEPEEWDAFRARIKEEFNTLDAESETLRPEADRQRVQAPVQGNFVIATQSSEALEQSLLWRAPLCMLGGVVASALGAWLALISGWSVWVIVGCVGAGFLVSLFFKSKGDNIWRLWLS